MAFRKMTKADIDEIENYPRPTIDTGPGKTKQSSKDESDINLILAKYKKTGIVNFVAKRQPEYMDMQSTDLHSAMNMIIASNEMFADMPSHLRKKFNNNPEQFLEFVHDPKNIDEMVKLGLAEAKEPVPTPPAAAQETAAAGAE